MKHGALLAVPIEKQYHYSKQLFQRRAPLGGNFNIKVAACSQIHGGWCNCG